MENITFYKQINIFLENKRPRKPSACVHRQGPTYSGLMHMYAGMNLRTQLGFQKLWKTSFIALMLRFGMNLTSFRSCSKLLFSHYIKPYMAHFQNTQEILREKLRFTRKSESKKEFFIKHPQVNFILSGTSSSLNPRVLKFTNHFCLVVNRFDWGEQRKSSQRAFCCEVYVLISFPSFFSF